MLDFVRIGTRHNLVPFQNQMQMKSALKALKGCSLCMFYNAPAKVGLSWRVDHRTVTAQTSFHLRRLGPVYAYIPGFGFFDGDHPPALVTGSERRRARRFKVGDEAFDTMAQPAQRRTTNVGAPPGLKIHTRRPAAGSGDGIQSLLVRCFPLLLGRPLCNCEHYKAPAG
jgi:hypothetical protein